MINSHLFLKLALVSTMLVLTKGFFGPTPPPLRCSGKDDGCCTASNPCERGDGDCDSDDDCKGSLECGTDNCDRQGLLGRWKNQRLYSKTDDCCCDPTIDKKYECGVWDVTVNCFSLDSLVTLSSGHPISLSTLKKGDLVKSLDDKGEEIFTHFLGWADKGSSNVGSFLQLATENGSIALTAHHFLMSTPDPAEDPQMKRADEVAEGDFLLAATGLQKVTSIRRVKRTGTGSPVTMTGDLLVNGVLASNYAHAPSHSSAHLWMTPFRWIDILGDEDTKKEGFVRRYCKLGSAFGDLLMELLYKNEDKTSGTVLDNWNIELGVFSVGTLVATYYAFFVKA